MKIVLECKQCGGEIPCEEGKQIAICPFCGSQNTISKSIEAQGGLVNRANYLRRNNEFDKALAIYEELLKLDNTDYEANWGLVLCRYGIEYVEDPATHQKIPTCHRARNESIYTDLSYKAALEYAPLDVREVYESEAAQIDNIQKNIIALSQREEKYDVFICYKEADDAGNRTEDSVIAQELEFELTKRGYRVFFARKTLEGKLGSAYEPIIFAALQSAKAMVVLGTKPEHFNAVWVKNEWSRYRELMRNGAAKALIPAYRGMSPYDLPQEFSNLQALDMSKLGFVQDLCDGIDRLTRRGRDISSEPRESGRGSALPGTEALLKRAHLFIEEGDFVKANDYLERVLDMDPEEPRAYAGKLMIEVGVRQESGLSQSAKPLETSPHYFKVLRFSDDATADRYKRYNQSTLETAKRLDTDKRALQEKQEEIRRQQERMLDECYKKLSAGAVPKTFGIIYLSVLVIVFIINLVKTGTGSLSNIILYSIPGSILLGIGQIRLDFRKHFVKYRSLLVSGAKVSDIARAAVTNEKAALKELQWLIKRKFLKNASVNNNVINFH